MDERIALQLHFHELLMAKRDIHIIHQKKYVISQTPRHAGYCTKYTEQRTQPLKSHPTVSWAPAKQSCETITSLGSIIAHPSRKAERFALNPMGLGCSFKGISDPMRKRLEEILLIRLVL